SAEATSCNPETPQMCPQTFTVTCGPPAAAPPAAPPLPPAPPPAAPPLPPPPSRAPAPRAPCPRRASLRWRHAPPSHRRGRPNAPPDRRRRERRVRSRIIVSSQRHEPHGRGPDRVHDRFLRHSRHRARQHRLHRRADRFLVDDRVHDARPHPLRKLGERLLALLLQTLQRHLHHHPCPIRAVRPFVRQVLVPLDRLREILPKHALPSLRIVQRLQVLPLFHQQPRPDRRVPRRDRRPLRIARRRRQRLLFLRRRELLHVHLVLLLYTLLRRLVAPPDLLQLLPQARHLRVERRLLRSRDSLQPRRALPLNLRVVFTLIRRLLRVFPALRVHLSVPRRRLPRRRLLPLRRDPLLQVRRRRLVRRRLLPLQLGVAGQPLHEQLLLVLPLQRPFPLIDLRLLIDLPVPSRRFHRVRLLRLRRRLIVQLLAGRLILRDHQLVVMRDQRPHRIVPLRQRRRLRLGILRAQLPRFQELFVFLGGLLHRDPDLLQFLRLLLVDRCQIFRPLFHLLQQIRQARPFFLRRLHRRDQVVPSLVAELAQTLGQLLDLQLQRVRFLPSVRPGLHNLRQPQRDVVHPGGVFERVAYAQRQPQYVGRDRGQHRQHVLADRHHEALQLRLHQVDRSLVPLVRLHVLGADHQPQLLRLEAHLAQPGRALAQHLHQPRAAAQKQLPRLRRCQHSRPQLMEAVRHNHDQPHQVLLARLDLLL